jgi:hypothetical protein
MYKQIIFLLSVYEKYVGPVRLSKCDDDCQV